MTTISVSLSAMSMAAIKKMMVKTSGNRSDAVDTIIKAWKRGEDAKEKAWKDELEHLKELVE